MIILDHSGAVLNFFLLSGIIVVSVFFQTFTFFKCIKKNPLLLTAGICAPYVQFALVITYVW